MTDTLFALGMIVFLVLAIVGIIIANDWRQGNR